MKKGDFVEAAMKVKSSELSLGDVIKSGEHPYSYATVKNIKPNGDVELFRPFTATADFSYTGGVICYIGVEEYTVPAGNEFDLIEKGPKLK